MDETPGNATSSESAEASSRFASFALPSLVPRVRRLQVALQDHVGILGLVVVVVLTFLFLPPFQVVRRLGESGYTFFSAEQPTVVHPDGLTVQVDPDDLQGRFGVRLSAVPSLNFLEGSAGKALYKAVEALPPYLTVKSPYYRLESRGTTPRQVEIRVQIPPDLQSWMALDLYTWDGERWSWVGGRRDAQAGELVLRTDEVPASLVLVQAAAQPPVVGVELPAGTTLAGSAMGDLITQVYPLGLLLGLDGGVTGDPDRLLQPSAGDPYPLLPSLRNWSAETGRVNQGLLNDLLSDPTLQQTHIETIVRLVVERGYAGVDVDYRGVTPEAREAYTAFIQALARALHDQNRLLSVTVEAPQPAPDGAWDTGGYDWRRLGMAADFLRFPLHRTGGERLEDLLAWATGEVSRYKLQPILTSLSVDEVAGTETFVSYQEALSHLGSVQAEPSASVVMPGQAVRLDLQDPRLRYDKAAGRYTYIYQDAAGQLHTVWLSTPSDLAAQLDQVLRYQLGGVTIRGLLEPGNAPGMTDVVRSYRDQALAQVPPSLQVLWTVQGPEGPVQETRPLDSPSYEWTVPDRPGQQVVIAAALQGSGAVPLGEVALRIATPTPEATPTPTAMPAAAAGITSTVGATPTPIAADCLDAAFVADVTIPDDTQLDNGAAFEKTWRLSNNGSCEWPADTVLAFVSGEPMGAPASVTVGPVAPGKSVDITVKMTAPAEPGRYRGYWQLQAGGTTFGDQVYVQIIAGELPTPTPGAPPPSSPPPVARGNFELGGHIRTWNYVQQMKYAGMTWAKTQVHYGQDASGWINAAHANGFKIQLSALGRPDMVTQPGFEQSFATWVASLAAAGADAIEVWNEPNIDREWQIGYISPQAYTNLLCTAYQAIKAANPNTLVISAAPAPTGYFGGCSPNGCDDQPWMEGLYNAGAANCMDFIGAHHNAGATSPSARSGHPADQTGHHSWYFLPQTELYYNIFRGTRQLFYTEMGYASQEGVPPFSDMFAWARGTNNAQQAAWLAEAVRLSISTGMVRAIIVWNIDFPRYGYDPQDGYAIIRPDGSCPACETLHQVMGGGG